MKITRRSLARFAADRLEQGVPASKIAPSLASVLISTGRGNELEALLGDIKWELEHRGILASAKVTTAAPLIAELEQSIKVGLKKATGSREVALEKNVDESVIGGMRVETAAHIWDSTLSSKLIQLRERF